MKYLLLPLFLFVSILSVHADAIDSLEEQLRDHPQIQEKIYVHTDNTCYFAGDTIWYRAFVVRSDNLQPSDISKILYVELLNGEGIVVDRQQLVIAANGLTHGDFALSDSLYSGYYEIRAYTRWNLNFGVRHRKYTVDDRYKFYNYQLAADYFRQWDGLYSRVFPIYAKPENKGEYSEKYIYNRPKEDLFNEPSPKLTVKFYPEGGNLVNGLTSRVAFEATDQLGRNVDVTGTLDDGTKLKTGHQGRGVFNVTAGKAKQATFEWNGKEYNFDLPKPLDRGVVINLTDNKLKISGNGAAAYAILCRGKLYNFVRTNGDNKTYDIDNSSLPTGINEIVVVDAEGQPVASRLFFVNHHDQSVKLQASTDKTEYAPYSQIHVSAESDASTPVSVSLSVRDGSTDDDSFDDGNILTDMLLSSELRGFIAYPGWYFKSDDKEHTEALDQLMMVQGWRRYTRLPKLRYQPEVTTTIEGHVYKLPSFVGFTELDELKTTTGATDIETMTDQAINQSTEYVPDVEGDDGSELAEQTGLPDDAPTDETDDTGDTGSDSSDGRSTDKSVNQHAYGAGALVEAEVEMNGKSFGAVQKADKRGRFIFNIPPYYGNAILFVKAYNEKDSAKYAMSSLNDKDWSNERAYPKFYVKRDMFYPIFSNPYSWYQTHQPEITFVGIDENDGGAPQNSKLAGDHQLSTVKVVASKRTRRGISYNKPAQILDVYTLYNNVTDYGLSFGIFEANDFPMQAATYIYGNLGMNRTMNLRARIDGTSFFRNYNPVDVEYDKIQVNTAIFPKMRLDRLDKVKVYTDYEPRDDGKIIYHESSPSVTLDFETFPDDAKQPSYRDRRYVLPGIAMPDAFYSPDYSKQRPTNSGDYRRTLYWNPSVTLKPGETFSADCYNNGKTTKVKVSAAGVTSDGKMMVLQ